jgi:hypothetical protein
MDTKYFYVFWRPVMAIHRAAELNDPRMTADPNWTPLRPTPQHPDYTSQHAVVAAASAETLESFFGKAVNFCLLTGTAINGPRCFSSFDDAAHETALSRIWLGYHTRTAVTMGLIQGRQVAHFILTHALGSLHLN